MNERTISHTSPSPGIAVTQSPPASHLSCSWGGISASCPPAPGPTDAPAAPGSAPHRLVYWPPRRCACPLATRTQSKSKRDGGRGKSSSCIHRVSVPQPRAHKSLLPTCNVTLLVAAIASSYDDGKTMLLVAIIKMGRGRHLLFSATAAITFLAQTFWS